MRTNDTTSIRPPRFALRKGQCAWGLTYEGEQVSFCDRAGMAFVEYLLQHPREPIHSLSLLARVQHQAPLQQRSAALDDEHASKTHLGEMERLKAIIESEETSLPDKRGATEELREIEQFGADIHYRTLDGAAKAARGVRQAIRRVCLSLAEARDEQCRPHPVLTAFAAHLRKYLLAPSQTGSTGYLVYEPPAGVAWK